MTVSSKSIENGLVYIFTHYHAYILIICSKHSNISGKSTDVTNLPAVSTSQNVSEFLSLPIKQWNVDVICAWFEQMGLFMYIADVRRHLRAGNQLLEVSFHLIFILSHCDVDAK